MPYNSKRNNWSDVQYTKLPNQPGKVSHNRDKTGPFSLADDNTSDSDGDLTLYEMKYSEENDAAKKTFTVEDAVEALGLGWFQARLYLVCGLISTADALEMLLLAFLAPFVRCEWGLVETEVAFITTVVFAGMCIFAPAWGWFGDRYGRRVALILMTTWIAYFGLLTSFAPVYIWILILRGLVGGGMAGSPQSFALVAEYIPSKSRAKLLVASQIFWSFGALFEVVLALVVVPVYGWRWLVGLSAVPITVAGVLLFFIPESARYLVVAGHRDRALQELQAAARLNKSSLPPGTLVTSSPNSVSRGKFIELFSKEYLRSTLQIWLLWFTAAFTYYGMLLASAQILSTNNAADRTKCKCAYFTYDDYVSMTVSTLGEFIALPVLFLLIDRFGRKVTGSVSLFLTGLFTILIKLPVDHWVLTLFMFVVRGMSSATFSFVYIYTSEVYPTSFRTLGMGTASSWARVGAMVTPFVAQVLLDFSETSALLVYGGLCIISAISCLFLPIETKGRALPQSIGWQQLQEETVSSESQSPAESSESR